MASSGTIVGIKSTTYPLARWEFQWSAEPTSTPGQTKVTWNLYTRGRSESPTWLITYCDFKIKIKNNDNEEEVYSKKWDRPSDTEASFNEKYRADGSFIVTHNSSGAGSFAVYMDGYVYETTKKSFSQTVTLDANYPYTACKAPTSIKATGIITPDGTFTVEWSGAENGNSNTITGYKIYYRISANGAAPTIESPCEEVNTTSTSGSKRITLSSAPRGHKVVCGIITKGSAGGNYYSNMKTGGSITINSLPAAPTVTVTGTTIPSDGSSILAEVAAGNDVDSSQTKTLYYAIGNGEKQILEKSPLSISKGGVYKFWTFDGLEFSSSVSKTISQNESKPTVSMTIKGVILESAKGRTGYSYLIAPIITLERGQNGQSSNNKYRYLIYHGDSSKELKHETILSDWTAKTSLIVSDIRTYIDVNQYYKISVQRDDGIEISDQVDSDIYYVTPNPDYKSRSNRLGHTTSCEPVNYFSGGIQLYFSLDSGYDQVVLTNKEGNQTYYTASIGPSDISGQSFAKIIIDENDANYGRGEAHSFYAFLKNSATGFKTPLYENIGTLTRTLALPSSEANVTWSGTVNPFIADNESISFLNFFNSTSPTEQELNSFGFTNSGNPPSFDVIASYEEVNSTISKQAVYSTTSTAQIDLSGNDIYNLFANLNLDKNVSLNYSVAVKVSITNNFGDVFSGTIDKVINWKTAMRDMSITEVTIGGLMPDSVEIIKENTSVKVKNLEVKSYHGAPKQIQAIGTNGEVVFYSSIITPESWTEGTETLGNNSPVTYSLTDLVFDAIGQQSADLIDTTTLIFKVIDILNQEEGLSQVLENAKVYKHLSGLVTIKSATYVPEESGESGVLTIGFNISDFGLDGLKDQSEVSVELKKVDNSVISVINEITFDEDSYTTSLTFSLGEDPYTEIYLEVTTTSYSNKENGTNQSIKKFTSNIFTLYNSVPTVAYRKNKLGINYNFLTNKEEGVVVISSHSGLNKIYLIDGSETRIIDLSSGKIDNFAIEGGSWDEIEI